MKKSLFFLSILTLTILSINKTCSKPKNKPSVSESEIRIKGNEAFRFCKSKGLNTRFCILIDMGLHSGVKRFFVWDFKNNSISDSFMVSHGCGIMPWSWTWSKKNVVFSNKDGSHCTAEGKYKVGKRGYSNWGIGINYALLGLDNTNSNAVKRSVVLHSWEKVPDTEVFPDGTPEGWGCPALSNEALKKLDPKLKKAKMPVLLWIYKS